MSAATPAPQFRLNLGEAFTFLFRDPHWLRKCGLMVLFLLLGFLILPTLLMFGYFLTLSERVMRLEAQALPEWTDFGALLRKGWRVFLVRLVYYMPIWLIVLLIVGIVLVMIAGLGGFGVFTGTTTTAPPSPFPFLLIFLLVPLAFLLFPLSLLLPCIIPAADAQLVLHEGQLEPAFRFGAVFAFIRRNFGQYAIAVIIFYGAAQVISGGSSASIQLGGNAVEPSGFNFALLAILGAVALIVWLATSIVALYLRCFLAHTIGQICWHETTVGGDGH
jgi:hypothetical protein